MFDFLFCNKRALAAIITSFVMLGCLPQGVIGSPSNAPCVWIDPHLKNFQCGDARVILIFKDSPLSEIIEDLGGKFSSLHLCPAIGSLRLAIGVMHLQNIGEVARSRSISAVILDRPLMEAQSGVLSPVRGDSNKPTVWDLSDLIVKLSITPPGADALAIMSDPASLSGARGSWDMGYTGVNVTIAIIDTGVDYGSLGLAYWASAIPRDKSMIVSALDADGQSLVYTNISLTAFSSGSKTYIRTAGTDPLLYLWGYTYRYSELMGSSFPKNMEVTNVLKVGEKAHFGVMLQVTYRNIRNSFDLFPVLVVDRDGDGACETAYVDLSFEFYPGHSDYSFSDEMPLTPKGDVLAARDFNGDGIFDISAGTLARLMDVWALSPNKEDRGTILQPIDPNGNFVCFEVDMEGHGTSCANAAAGRDVSAIRKKIDSRVKPGIAIGASVMGITALMIGDIIEGELWAAGFDLIKEKVSSNVAGYGSVYGVWKYSGDHKADIISNSWGISEWAKVLIGLPWYSVLTSFQDALMIPGQLDPEYPGTLVCQAVGNGGPGFGTVTEPSYSCLTMGVGASTSMNWTNPEFGMAGGYYDEVASWSGRGPTPAGYIKPDLLQVGAYSYAPTALFAGRKNGATAFELFGGTSMACPLAAGSAALVYNAYQEKYSATPSPSYVKMVLMSSASDLGYDPFLQGSGRVNCSEAIRLVIGKGGVITYSNITWETMMENICSAWGYSRSNFSLSPSQDCSEICGSSAFLGYLEPGRTLDFALSFYNPSESPIDLEISPYSYVRMSDYDILSGVTSTLPPDWSRGSSGFKLGSIINLNASGVMVPEEASLMVVTLQTLYSSFDSDGDNKYDARFRVFVMDWEDVNVDGKIGKKESYCINYGYSAGTTSEATISLPATKFRHLPVVFVSQDEGTAGIPFNIIIRYYERAPWDLIQLETESITISPGETRDLKVTAATTDSLRGGVYEGFLTIDQACGDGIRRRSTFPISFAVPTLISEGTVYKDLSLDSATMGFYDTSAVEGYFDWNWRYEAGDWREYFIKMPADDTILGAFFVCSWQGNRTLIDLFSINTSWMIFDSTDSGQWNHYVGDGIFNWSTRTGLRNNWVGLSSEDGIHCILAHSALFDGSIFPENLDLGLGIVRLKTNGSYLVMRNSQKAGISFNLSTGITLNNVRVDITNRSGLPPNCQIEITKDLGTINANSSSAFEMTVKTPYAIKEGAYEILLSLTSDEFKIIGHSPQIMLKVVIDNTPPLIIPIIPTNGSMINNPLPTISASLLDNSQIDITKCIFTVDGIEHVPSLITSNMMAYYPPEALNDGMHVASLEIQDQAGNMAKHSWSFVIDTAPPSFSTSPAGGSIINRTHVTISSEIKDFTSGANPEQLALLVDGLPVPIESLVISSSDGKTINMQYDQYLQDGMHEVSLHAYDRAGNLAITNWSFIVDASPPVVFELGLLPLNGSSLDPGAVSIEASFDDNIGLDYQSVQLKLNSVDYSRNASIQGNNITLMLSLDPGHYRINLEIRDLAGNTAEKTWEFTVLDYRFYYFVAGGSIIALLAAIVFFRLKKRHL
uniref:Uncharacterized protein n=1 Tax=Candidatus Methanomethylicus mesodigestus TaxID=1867258 RepID=A0A7C3EWJ4_9CREN